MQWLVISLQILQAVFLVGIFLILSYIAYITISFRNMVPYVPTPTRVIKHMIELAQIQKGERLCDLGSGTGKIIIQAARKNPHSLVIGIEKSFILRNVTKLRLLLHPFLRKRIQVIKQDFFNTDLSNLDVIFCFLTPEALRILEPRFKQLRRGSRIVSYMFPLEDSEGFTESVEHPTAKDSINIYKKI